MSRSEKPLGTRLSDELHGKVNDAVIALAGPPARLTKKKLVEDALTRHLRYLQKRYNEGDEFPVQKDRALRSGVSDGKSSAPVGKRKPGRVDARSGRNGKRAKGRKKPSARGRSRGGKGSKRRG